jgi:hypothetical protein
VLRAQAALEALRDHPAFEAAQDAAPERVHESPLATLATMLSDEVPLLCARHITYFLPASLLCTEP